MCTILHCYSQQMTYLSYCFCVKSTTSFIPLTAMWMYFLSLCFRFIQTFKYVALYIFYHFESSQPELRIYKDIVPALDSLFSSDTLITHIASYALFSIFLVLWEHRPGCFYYTYLRVHQFCLLICPIFYQICHELKLLFLIYTWST